MVLSPEVIEALRSGQVKGAIPLDSDLKELSLPATTWNGTKAASGSNEIVATPGVGQRIVVTAFVLQNHSTTAIEMILRSGATTNGWRCWAQHQGDGLAKTFHPGDHWKLNEDEALNLALSDADTCGVSVSYFTEST